MQWHSILGATTRFHAGAGLLLSLITISHDVASKSSDVGRHMLLSRNLASCRLSSVSKHEDVLWLVTRRERIRLESNVQRLYCKI